ncbi:hypothetical protein MRX96_045202 [Rhipicephalus microplus]
MSGCIIGSRHIMKSDVVGIPLTRQINEISLSLGELWSCGPSWISIEGSSSNTGCDHDSSVLRDLASENKRQQTEGVLHLGRHRGDSLRTPDKRCFLSGHVPHLSGLFPVIRSSYSDACAHANVACCPCNCTLTCICICGRTVTGNPIWEEPEEISFTSITSGATMPCERQPHIVHAMAITC